MEINEKIKINGNGDEANHNKELKKLKKEASGAGAAASLAAARALICSSSTRSLDTPSPAGASAAVLSDSVPNYTSLWALSLYCVFNSFFRYVLGAWIANRNTTFAAPWQPQPTHRNLARN